MPGAGMVGLAGLASLPQGYMAMGPQMTDQAAMEALGRGLQAMAGIGTQPTQPTAPTAPAGPGGPPPTGWGAQPILSRIGSMFSGGPAASPAPPVGPPTGPPMGPGPGMPSGQPPLAAPGPGTARPPVNWQMNAGPPLPSPPQMAGGGAGLPPGNPNTAFSPPPGGGGGPQMPHSMDWRDLVRAVVQANPGVGPDVIAAAVSKAMPLMNADSQNQWRAIQMQIQEQGLQLRAQGQQQTADYRSRSLDERGRALDQGEERLRQGQEKIDQADKREQRLRDTLDWRKDTKAQELQMKAQAARDKVTQFGQNMDLKQRQNALKEMDTHQRAYDSYMRSKISANSNLSGQDKKDAGRELDRQWGEYDQQRRTLQEQLDQDAKGGSMDENRRRGIDILKGGGGTKTGPRPGDVDTPTGSAKPLASTQRSKIELYLNQHPDQRDTVIHELQAQGFDASGF